MLFILMLFGILCGAIHNWTRIRLSHIFLLSSGYK
jgi:hypothetical protein